MTTYDFWSLAGEYLGTITTDDPFQEVGELSFFHGVDADEIEYEPVEDGEAESC